MPEAARDLAAALSNPTPELLLVVTGAGASHASGIPTFRGSEPDAIWRRDDVELATVAFFDRDPVSQWEWYLERFAAIDGAEPNDAHHALADLERWQVAGGGRFLLVTQNIDCLHERAGSRSLVKVHGSSDRVRCSRPGCENGAPRGSLPRSAFDLEAFRAAPSPASLPRCPVCCEALRAHVLFFDEYYQEHDDYRYEEVRQAARTADRVLFVGTSFSVGVTDLVLRSAYAREVPMISIDPGISGPPLSDGMIHFREPAELVLPEASSILLGEDR